METRFMKPAAGRIVRHPSGMPVRIDGEALPMNQHFLAYVRQGDLVDATEDKSSAKVQKANGKRTETAKALESDPADKPTTATKKNED
jgi:hypothetical protein